MTTRKRPAALSRVQLPVDGNVGCVLATQLWRGERATCRRQECDRALPTTRRRAPLLRALLTGAVLAGAAFSAAGCATRGPLHLYSLTPNGARPVRDTGDGRTAEGPSFLKAEDRVSGFAYDPFTDHFFLRLEPGNRIRVVDRPARAIKREFEITDASRGGGDLAVRPRDGHLFLLGPQPGQIIETTRLGKCVGRFVLADTARPLVGLALDTVEDRLLALGADGQRVTVHDLRGAFVRELRLAQPAGPSLAFDSDQREFHAPLRDRPGEIGVFDDSGRLLRTIPVPATTALIDVGPRSFVRVF